MPTEDKPCCGRCRWWQPWPNAKALTWGCCGNQITVGAVMTDDAHIRYSNGGTPLRTAFYFCCGEWAAKETD